ncbi:hypothetical protein MYSTI_00281 [Myxococcus stipitatus DSM 14675]|uniref:DUF2378 family protein n=1 Tax=Myxococcus stipitatus (strain DSM 14675 / JCM 12634 / Mx s8) TaxID=1278073 RepID=L7U555_MYXSD|nr:DUF2378 family protein [Myxococcus stipitatus]AGC41639.1 hypothetical protein MYSTI_00281 [Myxococcus stipitatus DSM 14675]
METLEPKLVQGVTIQGLFDIALKERLSEGAWRALSAGGLDRSRPVRPTYPVATWLRWQNIVLRDLWPDAPLDEAWRRLGHTVMEGLLATVLGRMLGVGARALGPQFALAKLDHAFPGTGNYIRSHVRPVAPCRAELWLSDLNDRPTYYVGVLEAVLLLAGATSPRCTLLCREGDSGTYLLEWSV